MNDAKKNEKTTAIDQKETQVIRNMKKAIKRII